MSHEQFAAPLQKRPATVMIRKGKVNVRDCPGRQSESPRGTWLRRGRSCAPASFVGAVSGAGVQPRGGLHRGLR